MAKQKSLWKMVVLLFFITGSGTVFGSNSYDAVNFGELDIGGNGCKSLTPDLKIIKYSLNKAAVKLAFNGLTLKRGARKISRKSCNWVLPISIDEGYKLTIKRHTFQGFSYVESSSTGKVSSEIFFATDTGTKTVHEILGPIEKSFRKSQKLDTTSVCGTTNLILRGNNSILLKNSNDSSADDFDIINLSTSTVRLKIEKCE